MSINSTGLIGPQGRHTQDMIDSLYLNGFAVDQSEVGTGKTYCAAVISREMGRPLFVISPKSVIPSWKKVLDIYHVKPTELINYELIGRGNTKWMKWKDVQDPMEPWNDEQKISLPDFRIPKNCLVVLDEGHRCKGRETTNSWMLISLVLQGYNVLYISGTTASSPLEMKAFGFLTQLHALYNFNDFCSVHGATWMGKFGTMLWDAASEEARKTMLELNKYLFHQRRCSSRMTRDDFGNLFPESQIIAEAYDLGPNSTVIQGVYETMELELAQLDESSENYSSHIFAIMMKARRKAEMCKVPLFCEMIMDRFDEGKSVAVFVNFTDTVKAITNRLGKNKKFKSMIAHVVGGQGDEEREKEIEAFQSNEKRVIVCNIAAGGVGINLHDIHGTHPRVSLISPTWSCQALNQSTGRIWRQGGTKSLQYILYAAGCIEEQICQRVQFKTQNLNLLNDGEMAENVKWIEYSSLTV